MPNAILPLQKGKFMRITAYLLIFLAVFCIQFIQAETKVITFVFKDFSNVSVLQLNGNSAVYGTSLQLTSAVNDKWGSVFAKKKLVLTDQGSFSTYFIMRMVKADPAQGADGIVFCVQPSSSSAGSDGAGIGYAGIKNSVGIEFDSYQNGWDADGQHIGIDTNGDVVNHKTTIDNGEAWEGSNKPWHVWIDYNGLTKQMEVRVSKNNTRPAAPKLAYTIDLAPVFATSEVYAGFTSATGGLNSHHLIDSMYFNNGYDPIDVNAHTYVEAPTNLTVSATPSSIPVGGETKSDILAIATNRNGSPARNVTVTFQTDVGTLASSTAVTNNFGQASVLLTSPITLEVSQAQIFAVAQGGSYGRTTVNFTAYIPDPFNKEYCGATGIEIVMLFIGLFLFRRIFGRK